MDCINQNHKNRSNQKTDHLLYFIELTGQRCRYKNAKILKQSWQLYVTKTKGSSPKVGICESFMEKS